MKVTEKNIKWKEFTARELCESITDCVNKTAPTVDDETPYKMIRTTNVRDGGINLSKVRYVTEGIYREWTRRTIPRKGDVILTREAPLGEVGIIKTNDKIFLGQRLVQYRANLEKLNDLFLLYALQSYDVQKQLKSLGAGSTVEHVAIPDCEKLILRVPPIREQKRIAAIASKADRLRRTRRYTQQLSDTYLHIRLPRNVWRSCK